MTKYVDDALAIPELTFDLENISMDDKKSISDYTQKEIVHEAEWVLSNFYESGHSLNESLRGDHGPSAKAIAKTQVSQLKAYIKKYSTI
jgi:hypothetical protein